MRLILLLLGLLREPRVDTGLEAAVVAAREHWGMRANIREVRWCRYEECWLMSAGGVAGRWEERDRSIVLLWEEAGPGRLQPLMDHEYGHALGLSHVDWPSVMNLRWEEGNLVPTEGDRKMARARRF